MTDISFLAHRQQRIARLSKYLDSQKKKIRESFFQIADEETSSKPYLLPTTSISVPESFFTLTGMEHSEFLKSRFPSWSLKSMTETDDGNFIFALQKRPEFLGYTASTDGVEISRSVSELTPEIDWDTMEKVDPDIFKGIAKPVVSYELDTEAFQKLIYNDPNFDAQGFLARHTKHKPPTLRVLAKIAKDE